MFALSLSLASHEQLPRPDATQDKKMNGTARFMLVTALTETLISISALVIGTLGWLGIIPGMPPAAGFALIALSVGITSSWITCTMLYKGKNVKNVKELIFAAFSSNPGAHLINMKI